MTRRPPVILSIAASATGGLDVTWQVDSFFPDSAEPEKVLIDLNAIPFRELGGDATSVEIPLAVITSLGVQVLIVGVSFWWSGSPSEEQQSVVSIPISSAAGGGAAAAAKPVVSLVEVRRRTSAGPGSITIAWESNNYNDGNIIWGPAGAPGSFVRNIRPVGEHYSGTFTTDRPLAAATPYLFEVQVRNTLHSPAWISTAIVVRSADDTLSVRAFLMQSGKPVTTPLSAVVGPTRSVHTLLVG